MGAVFVLQTERNFGIIGAGGERYAAGQVRIHPSYATATDKCKALSSLHEQQDCALFVQAMCVLHRSAGKNDITVTCFDGKGLPPRILAPAGAVKYFSRWCGQNHWHRHESGQDKAEDL